MSAMADQIGRYRGLVEVTDSYRRWAMVQRDRAFVQAFWNLHDGLGAPEHQECNPRMLGLVSWGCGLHTLARRLGVA
jgi:hypothetical protein